jgi:hypothetical protein
MTCTSSSKEPLTVPDLGKYFFSDSLNDDSVNEFWLFLSSSRFLAEMGIFDDSPGNAFSVFWRTRGERGIRVFGDERFLPVLSTVFKLPVDGVGLVLLLLSTALVLLVEVGVGLVLLLLSTALVLLVELGGISLCP